MTPSPSKFVTGSAVAHGALLAVLVFSPGFKSQEPPPQEQVELRLVNLIPTKVVDSQFAGGGGTPQPTPPTTQPPKFNPPPPQPEPPKQEPPKAEPVKPEPPKTAEPPKIKPAPEPDPEPVKPPKVKLAKEPVVNKPALDNPDSIKPATRKINLARNTVKPSKEDLEADKRSREQQRREHEENDRRQREVREATERRQREFRDQLANAANSVRSSASSLDKRLSGTKIEMPAGSGGEAYISYQNLLYNIYKPRWDRGRPDAIVDNLAVVRAAVTIARDGRVLSSRILQSSGIPAVDKAADRVLKSVNFIAPFPDSAKPSDQERTFTINFTVEGKSDL